MPVDYKGGEHSNLVYRSFVTPRVRLLFFLNCKAKNLVFYVVKVLRPFNSGCYDSVFFRCRQFAQGR
ncbi:hypothetical protein EVD32_05815 [Bacteroidales bacterium SW299]|nr:hypothetical protein [Bacteroidales bacterium SW299]